MNERIRQLAEQAGFDDRGSNHTAYMNFDHEKFAELIVKECAEIADTERPNSLGCGYITKTKGRLIQENFGVDK
jgi:hypothetical protein